MQPSSWQSLLQCTLELLHSSSKEASLKPLSVAQAVSAFLSGTTTATSTFSYELPYTLEQQGVLNQSSENFVWAHSLPCSFVTQSRLSREQALYRGLAAADSS
jgi:hypothetical protein